MAKKEFPLSKVYRLLESGPVVMVTTEKLGKPNIMTMSWHMMIEFEPCLVGFVVSDANYSFGLLKATKECGINIPTLDISEKAVGCGNTTGAKIDKFKEFDLTPRKASKIKPPLIEECFANLECRLVDTKMVSKYGLFIVEVVKAWVDTSIKNPKTIHHRGGEDFMVAGNTVKIKSRMK